MTAYALAGREWGKRIAVWLRGRRRLTSFVILAACLSACGSIAEHARPERLPIVDVHGHLQEAMSAEALLRLMDEAGVSTMVLQATRGPQRGTDAQALRYARRYPTRFVAFIGFQNRPAIAPPETWTHPTPAALALLDAVERNLKTGGFRGLGEIVLRYHTHEGPTPNCCPEVDRPADSALMFRIAALAARYQVPMIVHAEGEPKVVAAMERLLESHRKAALIWAHNCGRQSAEAIRRLLDAHPNLYCDLGGMTYTRAFGYGTGWPRSTPWTFPIEDGVGHLLPGMQGLFERFPDRFMVGMDAYFTAAYQFFPERVRRFRELLSALHPATARKLAHENAERLLGVGPGSNLPEAR
jgi:Tat protein secretion system quality control protein TatD with DNase activity